jgi:hypothetical protein
MLLTKPVSVHALHRADAAMRSVNICTFLLLMQVNFKKVSYLIAPCAAAAVRT